MSYIVDDRCSYCRRGDSTHLPDLHAIQIAAAEAAAADIPALAGIRTPTDDLVLRIRSVFPGQLFVARPGVGVAYGGRNDPAFTQICASVEEGTPLHIADGMAWFFPPGVVPIVPTIAETTCEVRCLNGRVVQAGVRGRILKVFATGCTNQSAVLVDFEVPDPTDPKERRTLPPVHLLGEEWRIAGSSPTSI